MPSSYTTDVDPAPATFDDVVEAFRVHHPDEDVDLLDRAYRLAAEAHDGQKRKTGHPYITHPLAVAWHLAHYGLDSATVAAALLHDTVEDTDVTLEQVAADFGPEIAALIDGVTKLDRIDYSSVEEAQAATIRKMVVAMAQDVRVLLIKLVDRLHNMRTVSSLREEKQRRVARETIDIYAPLAHRLGVQEIKHELEDRCFAILHPGPFAEIEEKLDERGVERSVFIEKMIAEVEGVLAESGISAQVTGRPKHHYSIYRKMIEQDRPFEDIHDLIGIRVIVQSTRDCYAALGLIHSHWVPISGRFKDYVAMPKLNLYQSLHTTVVGPDGKPLEVQLRTEEMHRRAESGIAAHWRYKEGVDGTAQPWIDLANLDEEDPSEFLANLKLDLYQDEVFVLTPAGDVKTLPQGATAVDFAYAVHTEVGHRCVGAKINGRLLPLSTRLSSGDIVEIITARRDSGPSRDWLTFVRTSRARSKIKQWFLKERRDQALTDGREETMAAMAREFPGLPQPERDRLLSETAEELGFRDVDTMFIKVGDGSLSGPAVASRARRIHAPDEPAAGAPTFTTHPRRVARDEPVVVVEGLDDMLVHLARCCGPLPGDPIEGFVTVGRGVSVHRSDCSNIGSLRRQHERIVDVAWAQDQAAGYSVWIQVEALDRTLLLRDVTAVISDTGGNITASSTVTGRDRVAVLRYEVELSDPGQLPRMLADVRGVDGVYAVRRIPQPE